MKCASENKDTTEGGKYVRIPTASIADALEEFGAQARVIAPMRLSALYALRPALQPSDEMNKVSLAYEVAIERLREQEAQLDEWRKWQENLLRFIEQHKPSSAEAEYEMAWPLLCQDARRAYYTVFWFVVSEIQNRKADDLRRKQDEGSST